MATEIFESVIKDLVMQSLSRITVGALTILTPYFALQLVHVCLMTYLRTMWRLMYALNGMWKAYSDLF